MDDKSFLEKLRKKKTDFPDEEKKLLKELMELKIRNLSGQLKETHKIKQIRKSIARLKTVTNENKIE